MNTELILNDDIDILNASSPTKDITISVKDVMTTLNLVSESYNVENISDISTSMFNTMLLNVGCRLIKPSRLYYTIRNDRKFIDYKSLVNLSNIYVYICFIYNKGISIRGFSNFLGISMMHSTSEYDNLDNCLTKISVFLKKCDNELQMNNARDSKQAILQLAYNNYVHAWNGDIKANEIKSSYKSLDDIRRERLEASPKTSADGVQ